MQSINMTIFGEPASKSNSRKVVAIRGKVRVIKSAKALAYAKSFALQCCALGEVLTKDVSLTIHIYYRTRRPDLDASLIMDCLQGPVYKNDRQVKELHLFHHIDKENPRSEITVTTLS